MELGRWPDRARPGENPGRAAPSPRAGILEPVVSSVGRAPGHFSRTGWPCQGCQDAVVSMTTECWRGDAAREWCHPLKPKAPAPTQAGPLAAGGGILLGRQLTSRAAPAQVLAALMQARPAPAGRQPPGRAGAVLRLVPFRPPRPIFPARSQQRLGGSSVTSPVGVRWVGGMCLCPNQFFLSALPRQTSRQNPSIPTWPRLEQCEGL